MSVKRRKMTNKEKALNAKIKKELQERGTLPPDKPKLNRKKYVGEAIEEWNGREEDCYVWNIYLNEAIGLMLGKTDRNLRVSQEAVGVAKTLKLALRLGEFYDKLRVEGRTKYTIGEKFEFIKDVFEA